MNLFRSRGLKIGGSLKVSKGKEVNVLAEHSYGTWRPQRDWKSPLFIEKAEGVYFFDGEGKRYLDFSSQLMCLNLGHGNEAVIKAIKEQAEKLPYVAPGFGCKVKSKAVEALLEVMPRGLEKFFFSTSGTEANEAAVKIIRMFFAGEGKYKIISRYRSYHGATAVSIALTGDPRRWFAEPMSKVPGVIFAPDAYCYRCPFGLSYPECGIQCAEYVDYMIKNEGNVAAVFVEPVVGTNGIIVPPKEYFPRLREVTDENNVLLVVDEVMSGWLRTDEWFAVQHWKVKPDVLTTAKGCTSAYTPLGITATTKEIADFFEDRFLAHGHTYAAHPLSLAPVPVVIEEYKKLLKHNFLRRVGEHLKKRLLELKEEHVSVGDVRGLGHFWAVEIVKNRETKKPFNTRADKAALKPLMVSKLSKEMLNKGLYLLGWISHFIVAPPLIITEEQIDEGVDVLDETLKIADKETES